MIGEAKNIGDSFEYTLDSISSVLSFDSFSDSTTGETLNKYF